MMSDTYAASVLLQTEVCSSVLRGLPSHKINTLHFPGEPIHSVVSFIYCLYENKKKYVKHKTYMFFF